MIVQYALLSDRFPILANSQFTWAGTDGNAWLNILLILICAGLLFYLLKQERQLVPKLTGWALMGLRLLMLGMILVTLFKPVRLSQMDREQVGKIVVGVDLSDSMKTIDQHASPEEKLRWARAMKLVRPDTTLEKKEPAESEEPDPNLLQQQAHEQNLQDVFQQVSSASRESILEQTLKQHDLQFRQVLEKSGLLEQFGFASSVIPLVPTEEPSSDTGENTDSTSDGLDRAQTSLTELLKQAIQFSASSAVNGVILFTDGQHNADSDLQPILQQLSQLNIPVYPVLLGSEEAPADILIKQLDYQASVYSGDQAYVTAIIQADDFLHTDLSVELYEDETLLEQQQVHTGTMQHVEKQITFTLPTDVAETRHYQIKLAISPDEEPDVRRQTRPRELTLENNEISFTQNVLDNTIRVLLIDRNPRWEFRYLHNALERDEKISLTTILISPPRLTDSDQPDSQIFQNKLSLPKEYAKSSFVDYDLIILGNVSQQDLSPSDPTSSPSLGWEHLEHFVASEGGSLVLLPGDLMLRQWEGNQVLGLLAPILQPEKISYINNEGPGLPTGMKLLPSVEGEQESFLQLAEQSQENQSVWENLPTLFHVYTGQPKIAASNLVEAYQEESRPPLPTFVQHQYGEGQVLWVGTDATWRWRFRHGDEYHHRFWGQIARWSTRNKLAVQTDLVRFGPEQAEVTPKQVVRVQAFWSAEAEEPLKEKSPVVEVYSISDTTQQVPLKIIPLRPVPDRPLAAQAELTDLPIGDYRLELKVPDSDLLQQSVVAPLSVRPQESTETIETVANRELLNQIATATNGRLFEIDEISRLPAEIQQNSQTESFSTEMSLWDHWLWLLLLIAVLGVEWTVRKWNGLP